jgi:hypothetical protein
MKTRVNPFNAKVCITISTKDVARKTPVCIVVRKVFLYAFCFIFIGVVGASTYAGISAYLAVDKLSSALGEQEAKHSLALAAIDSLSLPAAPAPVQTSEDVTTTEGDMPALMNDEVAIDGTDGSERYSDPWLTVEAAPIVESIEYENGDINGRVELVDWFNGGSEVFPRYTEATVIDVDTGLSFHVRRFGGQYHGDSEPMTAEDTAVMKQIVGGEWSWDRHSVWVKIGERYFSASINGMPHMTDPTASNNFPGHFCIHFFHSKVHETGRECPRHQAMVLKAFASADKLDEYLKTNEY